MAVVIEVGDGDVVGLRSCGEGRSGRWAHAAMAVAQQDCDGSVLGIGYEDVELAVGIYVRKLHVDRLSSPGNMARRLEERRRLRLACGDQYQRERESESAGHAENRVQVTANREQPTR